MTVPSALDSLSPDAGQRGADGGRMGRKGRETRRRIMLAARELMSVMSPVELSAVGIAKAAGMASATFYLYFRDVQDLLVALSEEVTERMLADFEASVLFREPDRAEQDTLAFLEWLAKAWEDDGSILHYRALEADRGNERFSMQRERWATAVLVRLFALFRCAGHGAPGRSDLDSDAEVVVLFTSMERLAAAAYREPRLRMNPQIIRAAQARILCQVLGSGKE